jgi:hypothetical protein
LSDERTKVTGEILTQWQLTKPIPPGSVMTPKVVAAVLQSIANGNYIAQSCQAAGINPRTLRLWREKGEADPDSVYAEFSDLLEQARAFAETENVAVIKQAAEKEWTAAAWLLERQYPERWGRRDAVRNTVDATHRLIIQFGDVTPTEASDNGSEDSDIDISATA